MQDPFSFLVFFLGFGLDAPCGSFPTWNILWFCDFHSTQAFAVGYICKMGAVINGAFSHLSWGRRWLIGAR